MNREEILEQFALVNQNNGFSPIAGKVLGVFYISNEKYISFNEIVETVGVTKGAVSKALKVLISFHRVNSIQDPSSSRKRLFYLDGEGYSAYMEMVVKNITNETKLISKCVDQRTNASSSEVTELAQKVISFNTEIRDFLIMVSNKYFPKD